MDYQAILQRKLKVLYRDRSDRKKVILILENYGVEDYEYEAVRVHLTIVKLAEGDIGNIQMYTEIAKQDYRDVLALAEYPRQLRRGLLPDGEEKQKLIKADKDEYENWLNQ